jgi:Flp pilus assembly protein TadG
MQGQRVADQPDAARSAIPLPELFRRAIRGFRRDQKGATAIEFALIALPFFGLLFSTIETALIFLVGQGLETATDNSARLIRTGQAQQAKFNKEDFRNSICDQLLVFPSCKQKLILDVRTAADFGSINLSTPVIGGKLNEDGFGYDAGNGDEIVVVRAFYEWPTVTQFVGDDLSELANGNHLLVATAAFRNEPFPW